MEKPKNPLKEIREYFGYNQTQVGDAIGEIREKSIFIPKERGKTGGRSIPIVPPLERLIVENNLRSYPSHFYVFGKEGKPGPVAWNTTHFYDWLARYMKLVKLSGKGHTLYAFKHSGAIMAYKAGVPISAIQVMIGHESASQTEEYLINLGLINPADPYLGIWPEF